MATASSLRGRGAANAFDVVAASQTDSALVAATALKRVRVLSVVINQGDTTPSAVTFNSKSAGAGTAISPVLKAPANGGFVLPFNERGYFETIAGEGLSVTTGAGSNTAIIVTFELVGGL